MIIKSKDYQIKAVEQLIDRTKRLLQNPAKEKTLVFKSPTGSGKTVMIADFIKKSVAEIEEDICFIWISVGKGNLHMQSMNKLNKIFDGYPRCATLEHVIYSNHYIEKHQVVFVNWEKLNNKKNNIWDNILMREGEKRNFQEFVQNTNEHRKIILIIDESHYGTDTKTSNELKSIINPEILLEMSATPKYTITQEDNDKNLGYQVSVDPVDVIKEGMIKKEIIVNGDFDLEDFNEESSYKIVLDMAIKRREVLKEKYQKLGKDINPLCLIQIPNSDKGNRVLDYTKLYLAEHGITESNGSLGVKLSGYNEYQENLENMEENNSSLDFLVFKQSIDTGWDCPRAQVLVKFRETKSETFNIQTVGRILRSPEQIHYEDEELNRGYLYTNNKDIQVAHENLSIIKRYKTKRKELNNVRLPATYKRGTSKVLVKGKILEEMFFSKVQQELGINISGNVKDNELVLAKKGFNFDPTGFQSFLPNLTIDTSNIDQEISANKKNPMEAVYFSAVGEDIFEEFNNKLTKVSSHMFKSLRPLVYAFFFRLLGYDRRTQVVEMQILFLKNFDKFFNDLLVDTVEEYKERYATEFEIEDYIFELPDLLYFDENKVQEFAYSKYAYDKCFLGHKQSKPEKYFEEFLEENANHIVWWYKNGDAGKQNFGIKYEYDNTVHVFYPDYIVLFNNGLIGIYEIKSEGDRDGNTITKAKAETLQSYIAEQRSKGLRIIGGIVTANEMSIKLNNKDVYDVNNKDDWSNLSFN